MDFRFDTRLAEKYKSNTQKVRVMSEAWVVQNMFCPCCGNAHLTDLPNNSPVADMRCDQCGEIFELKTKRGKPGKKVNGGAYKKTIDRITSVTNPNLFVMQYARGRDYLVTDLTLVPKFFFVPYYIEKRKPLGPHTKRPGWTGCNILYAEMPQQGKIRIIRNGDLRSADAVLENYRQIQTLQTPDLSARGWLMDVLHCVNRIASPVFALSDLYTFSDDLQRKHVGNHNIHAKIRQQLQVLRDKGFIVFLGRGLYQKNAANP